MRQSLELDRAAREALWKKVASVIEEYLRDLPTLPVAPSIDPAVARALLQGVDFETPVPPERALSLVVEGLRDHQVHNGHPRYFGLFNPATATMSVAADALAAAFNPQLAAWTHAPFACEAEQLVIQKLGEKFGYRPGEVSGSFTSGGAEANHSALLAALMDRFPDFAEEGARALPGAPVAYVSSESHHSFLKAARLSGIGASAVRHVPVNDDFVIDPRGLAASIREDRGAGRVPLFVVATLGTTGAGLVDPIGEIADVGHEEDLWVHADAAWGGAIALVPELRKHLSGVERADSITFDAHKWLSVPMAAGMFFTRHPDALEKTFGVTAGYMPRAEAGVPVIEPHRSSMQWTRRFIGLKLFLSLLVAGFDGYAETIRSMVRLGDVLRRRLDAAGFRVVNETPLPVACFQDSRHPEGGSLPYLKALADAVVESGSAWVSITSLGSRLPAIRACVTSFRTEESDLDALVESLSSARPRA
ncbi:MAG: pyridoxal phosphate-dependent decarboxylase family protein [Vicinamibacteria bacterium]